MQKRIRLAIFVALVAGMLAPVAPAQQQDTFPPVNGLKGFQFKQNRNDSKLKVQSRILLDQARTAGVLQVIVDVPEGWHIFSVTQKEGGPQRTEIPIKSNASVRFTGPFVPNQPPHKKKSEVWDVIEESHEAQVVWTAPLELGAGVDPQALVIEGEVKGQICSASSCLPLDSMDTTFTARLDPSEVYAPPQPPAGGDTPPVSGRGSFSLGTFFGGGADMAAFSWPTLLKNVGLGIFGGLILNLMPCVLPVIGLKLMSFIEQSQGSRMEALKLNLIYMLGIMSVFLVLATLSAFLNMGWGEHFTSTTFKVSMVILVFAMALSFLGVWEMPIPGFVGRGKSGELATKEGAAGAFFKGVFTTILATPCSGPFLGPLFGYTIKQPPFVTYVIMLSVGFGLALPYLVIGAFPSLMRWIPKPGSWMDTFKQLMGFVLLGATVFLISTIKPALFLPTLTLMFAVWFACWWVGRVPITAAFDRKLGNWVAAFGASAAIGFVAFSYLGEKKSYLDWTPYSESALTAASQEGKTVLIDFTAEWCLTCKLNMVRAIDTEGVNRVVEQLGVVPMLADWTDKSDEIKNKLRELDSDSIPLMAIYPAGALDGPIILRDLISEQDVLTALQEAGPSTNSAVRTADSGRGDISQTSHTTETRSPSL